MANPRLDGDFNPWKDGKPEIDDLEGGLKYYEADFLKNIDVALWAFGGHDEGEGETAPENCEIEIYVNWFECGSSVNLLEFLKANITGDGCGPQSEIIALEKLKTGIDEIIDTLRKQL